MEYLDNLINKPSKEAKSIQNTEHKSDITDERHYQDYTKSVISEAKHTTEVKDVQNNVNEDKTFGKKQNITIQQKKEPILMTSSKVPTRSLEKNQQNFSEKKQTNSVERSSQKVLQNKLIKSGERNQQKLSEKELINPGERNQLKHTEKKQIKPGERNQQKHTEKESINPGERNQLKHTEKKQIKPGERNQLKHTEKESINPGERNQLKHTEKESINPGERNQLKHTEKKQIKPGERNQLKHTEKKQMKPRARNQQKLPERKLADSKPNFSKQHQTRMQMNVFERLTQQKPPTKKWYACMSPKGIRYIYVFKGDEFCIFLLAFLNAQPFLKRDLLWEGRICSQ